jgi:hypothetical protein
MTLAERASGSSYDDSELRRQISDLRTQLNALSSCASSGLGASATCSRLHDVESQVGVSSYNRVSYSDLWSEVAKLKKQMADVQTQLNGYSGLSGRVASLERCVSAMRQNWGSSNAPYC